MAEFFRWLSQNPVATYILIVAVVLVMVAFTLAIGITVVAFIRNQAISIGGLRFGPEVAAARWIVQSGEENIPAEYSVKKDFVEVPRPGRRTIIVPVEFKPAFTREPKVVVSLKKIDLGDYEIPKINRLLVRAEQVRIDRFNLCFETWEDSRVYDAAASWIAFGE